jgi:type I restriction enzyme, R subunit
MRPDEKARRKIDQLLSSAGWQVQDYKKINLSAALGVAVRYFQLKQDEAN